MARYLLLIEVVIEVERMSARALADRCVSARVVAGNVVGVSSADALVRPMHSGPSIELRVVVEAVDEAAAAEVGERVRLGLHQHVVSRLLASISFGRPALMRSRG